MGRRKPPSGRRPDFPHEPVHIMTLVRPRGAEESEVLFTLIAERYERRSLGITSNLVFSEWERIFANPMATAAAIDRVMHHPSSWSLTSPATALMPLSNGAQTEEVNRQKMLDAGDRRP